MTKIYTMKRDGWLDSWEMHVSPNRKEMRRHVAEMFKKWRDELPEGMDETNGMVQVLHFEGKPFPFCVMFLNEEDLGSGVVAHECLHAALAHERNVIHFGMNYGDCIGDDEERLCYYLTSCVKGAYNTLYENGHIKDPPMKK